MKNLGLTLLLLFATGAVRAAALPDLSYTCGKDIDVQAKAGGPVRVNGKTATLKAFNENYYEARADGITVSIAKTPEGLSLSYTGKHRANGMCNPKPTALGPKPTAVALKPVTFARDTRV